MGPDKSDTVRRGPGNFDRDFGPGHVAYLRDKLDRVGAELAEARAEVERLTKERDAYKRSATKTADGFWKLHDEVERLREEARRWKADCHLARAQVKRLRQEGDDQAALVHELRAEVERLREDNLRAWTEVEHLRGALRYIAGFDVVGYERGLRPTDVAESALSTRPSSGGPDA